MNFLRLIRFQNLAIIALTMVAIYSMCSTYAEQKAISLSLDFILLLISTIAIAAAGNIINDYYDVEADKINKPKKRIVGTSISAKNSLILYWTLTSIGIGLGVSLSIVLHTLFFVISHSIVVFLLWWYSYQLKKVYLVGNLIISTLLAYVIISTTIYFILSHKLHLHSVTNSFVLLTIGINTSFFVLFAFLLNLAREFLKDVSDIEGDLKINSQSLAIELGKERTVKIARKILIVVIVILILLLIFLKNIAFLIDFGLTIYLLVKSISFLSNATNENIKKSIFYIKLSFIPPLLIFLIMFVLS